MVLNEHICIHLLSQLFPSLQMVVLCYVQCDMFVDTISRIEITTHMRELSVKELERRLLMKRVSKCCGQ